MPPEKIWKAKVTGLADGGEFIPVLALVAELNGAVCSMSYTIPNVGELVVQFENEDDVKAFDISVCDLGYDIEWD